MNTQHTPNTGTIMASLRDAYTVLPPTSAAPRTSEGTQDAGKAAAFLHEWSMAAGVTWIKSSGDTRTYQSVRWNDLLQLIHAARVELPPLPAVKPKIHTEQHQQELGKLRLDLEVKMTEALGAIRALIDAL